MDIKKYIRQQLEIIGVPDGSDAFDLIKEEACIMWDDGGFDDLVSLNRWLERATDKLPEMMFQVKK